MMMSLLVTMDRIGGNACMRELRVETKNNTITNRLTIKNTDLTSGIRVFVSSCRSCRLKTKYKYKYSSLEAKAKA